MVPSLRSVDPSLHRHRQREAAMADMRHHSVTPTGGEGAGLVVPIRGASVTRSIFLVLLVQLMVDGFGRCYDVSTVVGPSPVLQAPR